MGLFCWTPVINGKSNMVENPQTDPMHSGVSRGSTPCSNPKVEHVSNKQSPVQQVPWIPCTPTLPSKNQITTFLTVLKTILINYMNTRRTNYDRSKYLSWVETFVHQACQKLGKCICYRIKTLFIHMDNCRDFKCPTCQSFCITGGNVAVNSGYDVSGSSKSDMTDDYQRRFKRLKGVSPETQYFQPAQPLLQESYIRNETLPVKDTSTAGFHSDSRIDDVYVSNDTFVDSEEKSVPMSLSEFEMGNGDEVEVASVSYEEQQASQYFQPHPESSEGLCMHDKTSPTKDTASSKMHCGNLIDDVYVDSTMLVCSEEESVPICSSETNEKFKQEKEEDKSEQKKEEKEVRGKSEKEKQGTNTDPNIGLYALDYLTAEEIKAHLSSLRTGGQLQDIEGSDTKYPCGENTCNLCGEENRKYAPKPMYCSACSCVIKEDGVYYSTFDETASKSNVCTKCFKGLRRNITLDGKTFCKSKLQKEKNIIKDEEPWVQCNKCCGWQHQTCGLYNDMNDLEGNTEYVCPNCYLVQIEAGDHKPIPNTPIYGAKNLPTTKLGDYIEKRLFRLLKREREERAKASGKNFYEVPKANDLTVRVVVSVNKLLHVNEQFSKIISDEKYPSEFPYRSKVILLFQNIEGVDVCLFAMHVQEYGSECGGPNQRSIYISQLDSVKHFKPEIRSAYGESLRTFVYHEILIGYLDYCKRRGFGTAYIWSCPPAKGDDYIFYCHPKTQKTPKPAQLRQWYKSMLKKAAKKNIVANFTNLYDHYFVPKVESNIKVSAASLPYFDGDYWSVAAIGMINNIEKESLASSKKNSKEDISRRTLKALGHKDLSTDAIKEILLMKQLGDSISPLKDDFIMVHLQVTCTNCHEVILSGTKWLCRECKNFLICSKCHESLGDTHNFLFGRSHSITPVAVSDDVAENTEDNDAILETVHFENRSSFLSLCQGNELRGPSKTAFPYQFDTLRRAKHSTMMVLHHLHASIRKSENVKKWS